MSQLKRNLHKKCMFAKSEELFHNPKDACMVYIPTFTIKKKRPNVGK